MDYISKLFDICLRTCSDVSKSIAYQVSDHYACVSTTFLFRHCIWDVVVRHARQLVSYAAIASHSLMIGDAQDFVKVFVAHLKKEV